MKKKPVFIAIICLLAAANVNADIGLGLSLKGEATVGLDSKTISMINNLPAEIKKQVLLGLEEALPLLDKSVLLYLQEIQKIINGLGPAAFCAAKGAKDGLIESDDNLASDLEKRLIKARARFDEDSNPDAYQNAYSLIERDASRALCVEFPGTNQEERINEVRKLSGRLATIWFRLKPYCGDAYSCQIEAVRQVEDLIRISNQTDVKNFKSEERLQNVPPPLKPTFFKSNYNVDVTETNLSVIIGVNDELVAAKRSRKARYDKAYPVFSQALTKLIVDFEDTQKSFPTLKPAKFNQQVKSGCIFYYNSRSQIVDIKNKLASVVASGFLQPVAESEEQAKVSELEHKINTFANVMLTVRGLTLKPDACYMPWVGAIKRW